MDALLRSLNDLVEQWGWWGVFVLMALQGAALPVANEITMMSAGWLLIQRPGNSPWLILWAGAVGAVGWVVGALVAYAIMATGGGALLDRLRARFSTVERGLARSDAWILRWGVWAAFIARLLPVGRTIITLPLGAARVPVVPFALATFAGGFLWSTFLAGLGYLAGSQWEQLREQLGVSALPVALGIVAVSVVVYVVVHWVRRRGKVTSTTKTG